MFISDKLPSTSTLPEQAKSIVCQAIDEVVAKYENQIKALKDRADSSIPAIRNDIENCRGCFMNPYVPEYYETTPGRLGHTNSPEQVEKIMNDILAQGRMKLEAIHEKNLPAIENNKIVCQKISALMSAIGVKERRVPDPKSRSRSTKYINEFPGYLKDISNIVDDDGYAAQLTIEANSRSNLAKYLEKKKVEKEAQEKKEAAETKRVDDLVALCGIAYRWNNTSHNVLEAILNSNKYLRLAHYLSKNRSDWSNGTDYAEEGLRGFTVETDEDALIHDQIDYLIRNWDVDGRCFRNCEYGYEYLFKKVDPTVLADYNAVVNFSV